MIFKFLPLEANLISRLFIQDYTSQTEIPLVLFLWKEITCTSVGQDTGLQVNNQLHKV